MFTRMRFLGYLFLLEDFVNVTYFLFTSITAIFVE